MKQKIRKITKADITHISFVPKAANGANFLIVKSADIDVPEWTFERPILKLDDEKRLVTGIVYAPNVVDSQGEFMDAAAIETAAHSYMAKSQAIDEKHTFETNEAIKVVESWIEKQDSKIGDTAVTKGTWLITAHVSDDDVWDKVKKGEYKGFSMGGKGTREEIEIDDTTETLSVTKEERSLLDRILGRNKPVEKAASYTITRDDANEVVSAFNSIARVLGNIGVPMIQSANWIPYEDVVKSGKRISGANKSRLKTIFDSLGELLGEFDDDEKKEDENVSKEEIEKMIVEGIEKALAKNPAEPASAPPTAGDEPLTKDAIVKMIADAIAAIAKANTDDEPLTKEYVEQMIVKAVEDQLRKVRGASTNLNDGSSVEKQGEPHFLHGIL